MLGTNPIAIAFPGKEEPPIVIDMATSATAYGKIEIALRKQKPIPEGWAIDASGPVTQDPRGMIDGGALQPLGGDREHGRPQRLLPGRDGRHPLLRAERAQTGARLRRPFALGRRSPSRSVGHGIGHFFGAMRIDGFIDPGRVQAPDRRVGFVSFGPPDRHRAPPDP